MGKLGVRRGQKVSVKPGAKPRAGIKGKPAAKDIRRRAVTAKAVTTKVTTTKAVTAKTKARRKAEAEAAEAEAKAKARAKAKRKARARARAEEEAAEAEARAKARARAKKKAKAKAKAKAQAEAAEAEAREKKKKPKKPAKPAKPPKPRVEISGRQLQADGASQDYLGKLMDLMSASAPELQLSIKSFINADGSVDSELRVGNLPEEWRAEDGTPALKAFLSQLFRIAGTLEPGSEGGRYWISVGVRFGPQNESEVGELEELYKRHRGMFQVASHALQADMASGLQNAVVSIGTIVKSLQSRRGLPPSVIFIRITWLPVTDTRPHRYEGEKGGGY